VLTYSFLLFLFLFRQPLLNSIELAELYCGFDGHDWQRNSPTINRNNEGKVVGSPPLTESQAAFGT